MRAIRTVLATTVITLLGAGALLAQKPAMKPHPKVKETAARATALARVPHSTVRSEELEHEGGRWIYSYDLAVAKQPGIEEVNVDANTGKVVALHHEKAVASTAGKMSQAKPATATSKAKWKASEMKPHNTAAPAQSKTGAMKPKTN
jgi:hypothetical protein